MNRIPGIPRIGVGVGAGVVMGAGARARGRAGASAGMLAEILSRGSSTQISSRSALYLRYYSYKSYNLIIFAI